MVEKKYIKIGVVALAAVALIVGISVGVTQSNKNKNNSVAASANGLDYTAYDYDEYCTPGSKSGKSDKGSKSDKGGSSKSDKGDYGRGRKLIMPGTEDYAEELGENKRRKLRNDLVRQLSGKGRKSGKGSKSSKGSKGYNQQAPAVAKAGKSCIDICDAGKSGKGDKGGSGSKSNKGSGKSDKSGESGSKSDKGDYGSKSKEVDYGSKSDKGDYGSKSDKGGSGKSDKGGSGKSGKGSSPAPTVCDYSRKPTTPVRPPTGNLPDDDFTDDFTGDDAFLTEPTPAPSSGSTPTVSTDATGPPTKASVPTPPL